MILKKKRLVFHTHSIIEYMWALFVVLNGNTVYHASSTQDYHFPIICTFFSVILCLLVSLKEKERKTVLITIFLFCFFGMYFLIKYNTLAKEIYLMGYVISLPLLFLYFVSMKRKGKIELLFFRIEDVILFLAKVSLVIWVFGSILNIIPTNTNMIIEWGQLRAIEGYFGIHYNTQYSNFLINGLVRNTSIFCEGPMFSLWLSIALSTEMFLKESSNRRKILLLVVTIFSTITLTGVLFVIICFLFKYFISVESVRKKKFIIFSFVGLAVLPVVFPIIYNIITQKMTTHSYLIRMQDYIAGILVWKENPLFGSGFGNLWSLQKYVLSGFTNSTGFSNGITAVLATGGLWNFSIYLLGIIAPMLGRYNKKKKRVAFSLLYCYLTVTTIFFARYIAVVFIAFGLANLPMLSGSSDCNEEV